MDPKQIERMLKTQEIKTTLPFDFPERTINEGYSAPAYNTLLVSDTFIIGKHESHEAVFWDIELYTDISQRVTPSIGL